MPIYEYRCHDCGEQFEKFERSMSTRQSVSCPKCGSNRVMKIVSLFGMGGSSAGGADAACAPTGG